MFVPKKATKKKNTQPTTGMSRPKELCHAVAAMGFTVVRLPFSSEMLRVERVPPGGAGLLWDAPRRFLYQDLLRSS